MRTATTKTATPSPPIPPSPWSKENEKLIAPPIPPSPWSEENEKLIADVFPDWISLSARLHEAARKAKSFKSECSDVDMFPQNITEMLGIFAAKTMVSSSPSSLYQRPTRRIVAPVSRNVEAAIALMRKCRRCSFLHSVSATDFMEVLSLLDNSTSDLKWLFSIFDEGRNTTLPVSPIAINCPIFSWIWACIASLYMVKTENKGEAVKELALIAQDNDRNKKIIVEEGGVPPLLNLLRDASVDVQIARATTLVYLANDEENVFSIIDGLGVSIIIHVLNNSPVELQIKLANLVARMAEHSSFAQEEFDRKEVIFPLVILLSRDISVHEPNFHSTVEIEEEDPEVKLRLMLKISCAEALGMLARGNVSNSRRIAETKGLLCLANLVEKGEGDLMVKCLIAIMEITITAESNSDLRRAVFNANSRAARVVLDQLLKVIKDYDDPILQIPAIKSIGSLARTFTVKETRVIPHLVEQLSHRNHDVAVEAAIALEKFVCPQNFHYKEHSKRIIECEGLLPLRGLCRGNEQTRFHGLILLGYLVLHAWNTAALVQVWVLDILEENRAQFAQHIKLGELIKEAVGNLKFMQQ